MGDAFTAGIGVIRYEDEETATLLYGGFTPAPGTLVYGGVTAYSDSDDNELLLGVDYRAGPLEIDSFLVSFTESNDCFFVLDGWYYFGGGISSRMDMRGGLSVARLDFGNTVTSTEIKAGIEVSENVWLDAGVGRISGDFDDVDTFSVGINMELGDRRLLGNRIRDNQRYLMESLFFF